MSSDRRDDPAPPSLVRRVALASAGAAALGGALAAVVGGIAASRLVASHEDDLVRAAAVDLAEEVDEEIRGDGDDDDDDDDETPRSPAAALAHELEDVKLPGARARLRDTAGHDVGDPISVTPRPGACELSTGVEEPRRACTVSIAAGTLTLEVSAAADRERTVLVVLAVALGAFVGAVLGGGLSSRIGRWAAEPLLDLRDRVRGIRTAGPDPSALTGRSASSETEELRVAIADLVGRLAEALAQAQAFAGHAAHELRTPLATMAAELELLAEGSDRPAALERVRRQLQGLVALVQRLLVLARPSDSLAREGAAVDLGDVVAAMRDELGVDDAARVDATIDDDVLVRGDPDLLRALLGNAVGNALKFAAGTVEVRVRAHDDEARIDVVDDGPGISASERERVFTPFYRTASARASGTKGHGIGLALVAHVARAHGGDVELVDVERGTHLRVRLPRWSA